MKKSQTGFTILELQIATVVFSVMLLLITTAMLSIGKSYYKGVNNTKVQQAARVVSDSVAQNIQFNGTGGQNEVKEGVNGYGKSYCIGAKQYTYVLNQKVNIATNQHGLVVGPNDPSSPDCQPQNITGALPDGYEELLPDNTRLGNFEIIYTGSAMYKIIVNVGLGPDDLFIDADSNNVPDLPLACKSETGSQYCAFASLTTSVQKRIE